ncbi:hypothetical protein GPECTOR_82g253 [Gonium pectorale]|uniref:Uncharacterized protein n=1 Tax=Gonium pectorale TaxID=33097 RepID=A0A150G1G9_GONPE|nr:hypothetical protein GPECTOR_82g253 [Gonium pectorale]|eukprot:KXZ43719.1 hypothetical protein GPECTOR_82g253 [Gonium pectorale]
MLPGLGLVPIVLDADADEDGLDDEDREHQAGRGDVIIEEEHSDVSNDVPREDSLSDEAPYQQAARDGGSDSGSPPAEPTNEGDYADVHSPFPPFMATAAENLADEALRDMLAGLVGWDAPFAPATGASAAAADDEDAVAATDGAALYGIDGVDARRSGMSVPPGGLNISEAQLQDIIQQAVHGMAFEQLLSDEDIVEDVDDEDEEDLVAEYELYRQPWLAHFDGETDAEPVEPAEPIVGLEPPQEQEQRGEPYEDNDDERYVPELEAHEALEPADEREGLYELEPGAAEPDNAPGAAEPVHEPAAPDSDAGGKAYELGTMGAGELEMDGVGQQVEPAVDSDNIEDASPEEYLSSSEDEEPEPAGAAVGAPAVLAVGVRAADTEAFATASHPAMQLNPLFEEAADEHLPTVGVVDATREAPEGVDDEEYQLDDSMDDADDSAGGDGGEPASILGMLGSLRYGTSAAGGEPAGGSASAGLKASSSAAPTPGEVGSNIAGFTSGTSFLTSLSSEPDDGSRIRVLGQPPGGSAASLPLPRSRYSLPEPTWPSLDPDHVSAEPPAAQSAPLPPMRGTDLGGPSAQAKRATTLSLSSSLPSPFAGSVLDLNNTPSLAGGGGAIAGTATAGGGGVGLGSTIRMSSQSLSAIRQAALQAESQRQAEFMAERLGGGGLGRPGRAGVAGGASGLSGLHPFSAGGSENDEGGLNRTSRRSSGSPSSTGYANVGPEEQKSGGGVSDEDMADLEDLLRDRAIIQPRYPTDAKRNVHVHDEDDGLDDGVPSRTVHVPKFGRRSGGGGSSGGGSREPQSHHRRSTDAVDLEVLSAPGESAPQPPARSLLAMRKSDDGNLPLPVASNSPRSMSSGSSSDSLRTSSSAQSVADERLVDELEALREELGQKTTLVAGLRGELRKYTELAAQGLDSTARLPLYRDVLAQAQMQIARSGGPAPPDLRDAQELLQGKEVLDAGTEKVMLIKLQKLVAWGCEAAWKASSAQQHARFMEQQVAHARAAWEAERAELNHALELARSASPPGSVAGGSSFSETSASGGAGGEHLSADSEGLRRQLEASQEEAAAARAQVSDLESVVASLSADVRKLRGELRRSRDGSSDSSGHSSVAAGGGSGAAAASHADSLAWAMERQMLLKTITSLQQELEESQAAAEAVAAATAVASPHASSGAATRGLGTEDEDVKKAALYDAMLERVEQLRGEREAALGEAAALRKQLEAALAAAAEERADLHARLDAAGAARDAAHARHRAELEQLESELAAARRALLERGAEMASDLAEREAAHAALLTKVSELERTLEARTAEANVVAESHRELAALLAEQLAAGAVQDAELRELRQRLADTEARLAESEALASEVDGLQYKLEAKTKELLQAQSQLADVQAAITPLQAEAAALQAQVSELQALLAGTQSDKAGAEVRAAESRAEATAAAARAAAASAALAAVQAELEEAREQLQAYKRQAASREDEILQAHEDTATIRARSEAASAALEASRGEVMELRSHAEVLRAEARELRAALSAAEGARDRLQASCEQLEGELEAQRSLAGLRGERIAELNAALLEMEERYNCAQAAADTAAEAAGAAVEAAAEAKAALAEAQAAQQAAQEALQEQVAELQRQLTEAAEQREGVERREADLRRRLADAMEEHERAEQQLTHMEVQLEAAKCTAEELRGEEAVRLESLALLKERLQEALAERGELREAVAALRQQLDAAARAEAARSLTPKQTSTSGLLSSSSSGELRGLRDEKARLQADMTRLQVELGRVKAAAADAAEGAAQRSEQLQQELEGLGQQSTATAATAAALAEAESRVEALQQQLHVARSELQTVAVELSMKGELLAAKDRSLATLQETVDALKVALQATQHAGTGAITPSAAGAMDERVNDAAELHLQQYRATVAALQCKFADSELTIRRLEQQVTLLEKRLAASSGGARASGEVAADGQRPRQLHELDGLLADLRLQLTAKDQEVARLLDELDAARRRSVGRNGSTSPTPGPGSGSGAAISAGVVSMATVSELQSQNMQLRSLSEDLNARYQSKKETVRRLRAQLVAEQQRHTEEGARDMKRLDAAYQRLSRLATDLGSALRRCITLDLQPLSATSLTTNGHTQFGGNDLVADINTLAALLARQGAALVESLETALEQAAGAREERQLIAAQLAHRQAALDELRFQLSRSEGAGGGESLGTSGIGALGGTGSQVSVQLGTSIAAEMRQAIASAVANRAQAVPGGSHTVTASGASQFSPGAAPRPFTKLGQPSTASLAQDMAFLSSQQAGVRSTLHQIERSPAPFAQPRSPKSYSPGGAGFATGNTPSFGPSLISVTRTGGSTGAVDLVAGGAAAKRGSSYLGLWSGADKTTDHHQYSASGGATGATASNTNLNIAPRSPHRPQSASAAVGSYSGYGASSPRGARDTAGTVPAMSPTHVPLSKNRGVTGYPSAVGSGAVSAAWPGGFLR